MRFRYLLLAPLVFAWTSAQAGQTLNMNPILFHDGSIAGIPEVFGNWKLEVEFAPDPSKNHNSTIKKLSIVRDGVTITMPSAVTGILPTNNINQIQVSAYCDSNADSSKCNLQVYFKDPSYKPARNDGPGTPDYLLVFNLNTGKLREMFFMAVRDHGRSIRPIPINLKMWCSPSEIESVLDPEAVK